MQELPQNSRTRGELKTWATSLLLTAALRAHLDAFLRYRSRAAHQPRPAPVSAAAICRQERSPGVGMAPPRGRHVRGGLGGTGAGGGAERGGSTVPGCEEALAAVRPGSCFVCIRFLATTGKGGERKRCNHHGVSCGRFALGGWHSRVLG